MSPRLRAALRAGTPALPRGPPNLPLKPAKRWGDFAGRARFWADGLFVGLWITALAGMAGVRNLESWAGIWGGWRGERSFWRVLCAND